MMTCEHYESVGALRAERGEADPHCDTCDACKTEHAMRRAIIAALPLVDADSIGDPNWQQRVWQAIERDAVPRRVRPAGARWFVGSAFASACVLLVVCWIGFVHDPERQVATAEIIAPRMERGGASKHGHVGDVVHVRAASDADVRIFHEDVLVRWCAPGVLSNDCSIAGDVLTVDVETTAAGWYHVIVAVRRADTPPGPLPATSRWGTDFAALSKARVDIKTFELEAR